MATYIPSCVQSFSHSVFNVCLVWKFFLKFKCPWLLLYFSTEETEVIPFIFSVTLLHLKAVEASSLLLHVFVQVSF